MEQLTASNHVPVCIQFSSSARIEQTNLAESKAFNARVKEKLHRFLHTTKFAKTLTIIYICVN